MATMSSISLGRMLEVKKELQLVLTRRGLRVEGNVPGILPGNPLAHILVTLPREDRPELFLHSFYVNVRTDPSQFTDEEKSVGKGLGKLMLCALIKHLNLDPATPVELEASGGTIPPGYDPSKEDMAKVDAFLAKYPTFQEDLEYDGKGMSKDAFQRLKAETYIRALENQKLIHYYRGYGFEIVPSGDVGPYAAMRSTVGQILAACGKSGGRRNTYRRRGRKRTQRRLKTERPSRG